MSAGVHLSLFNEPYRHWGVDPQEQPLLTRFLDTVVPESIKGVPSLNLASQSLYVTSPSLSWSKTGLQLGLHTGLASLCTSPCQWLGARVGASAMGPLGSLFGGALGAMVGSMAGEYLAQVFVYGEDPWRPRWGAIVAQGAAGALMGGAVAYSRYIRGASETTPLFKIVHALTSEAKSWDGFSQRIIANACLGAFSTAGDMVDALDRGHALGAYEIGSRLLINVAVGEAIHGFGPLWRGIRSFIPPQWKPAISLQDHELIVSGMQTDVYRGITDPDDILFFFHNIHPAVKDHHVRTYQEKANQLGLIAWYLRSQFRIPRMELVRVKKHGLGIRMGFIEGREFDYVVRDISRADETKWGEDAIGIMFDAISHPKLHGEAIRHQNIVAATTAHGHTHFKRDSLGIEPATMATFDGMLVPNKYLDSEGRLLPFAEPIIWDTDPLYMGGIIRDN